MKTSKLLFAAAAMLSVAFATAGDVKVIANTSVKTDSVSVDEVRAVFLATKSSLSDGSHVEPVLQKGGATHEGFLKEFVGKTDSAYATYFRSLVFTGKASMPKTLASDADVVSYVAKTKGAIGYVSASAETADVKVLDVK